MLTNKLKMVFALAIISMVTLSAQAFSQDYCYYDNWTRDAGAQWWNSNVPAQYALSAEQTTNINDIRTKTSEKVLPLQNELRALRIESHGYNSNPNADIEKIKSYRNKTRNLEDKISDHQLDARGKINKLLTKEQRLYLNDGGYGWWDMDDNWWHSNHRGMSGNRGHRMMNRRGCCGW
jgi:Spy/CpxP family protein refolding chaperone